jgi:antitoxin component YwqK of YwqJK toxin-antitoxin module
MKLILSAILLIPHLIFAQGIEQDCNFKPIKINDSVYHVYLANSKLLHEYSETNCLIFYMRNKDGKPNGTFMVFDNLKKKRWQVNFKDQEKYGKELKWYATGQLEYEILYKENKYFDQTAYTKDGKIYFKVENENSGKANRYYYYSNGIMKSKIEFDSVLVHDKHYLPGANVFRVRGWHNNGNLKETGLLFGNIYKFGKWTYYDKNGKLTKTQEFNENDWVIYEE